MTDALVRELMPEEREFARFLAEIETRKLRVATLQAELTARQLTLGRFEAEYNAVVGTIFVERDRVRLDARAFTAKIARLRADPNADPEEVAREVEELLRAEREELAAQERETRASEASYRQESERPRLPPDDEVALLRMYRDLAKRFHPDLAATEEERRQREPLMRRVNEAMRERDLAAMRGLLSEAEVTDPAFDVRSIGDKLVWAIREIDRLDKVLTTLEADLTALRVSPLHELWQRQEAGERVLERLREHLDAELAAARDELAALIAVYRELIAARSARA